LSRQDLTEEELHALAQHIRGGPILITPPDLSPERAQTEYLIPSGFKWSMTVLGGGPLTELVLYRPGTDFGAARLLPIVRQFEWDFARDRESRASDLPISWPSITISYYQLNREDTAALDAAFRDLQTVAALMPLSRDGLGYEAWYGEGPSVPPAGAPQAKPVRMQVSFWSNLAVDLDFSPEAAPELAEAWTRLWNAYSSRLNPAQELPRVTETYDITPEQFANLITGSGQSPPLY
jgi:hypothetical protein